MPKSRAAREVSGKPSAGFLEIMLCDIGDLSACKALGFKVPPDTPSFATPPINEFVSKVLAKADEKCGQKREADFCRELAIVLRGDLGAILRFTAGKQNPDFLAEAEALDNLLSPGSLVAGGRNSRSLRNGAGNAKTSALGATEVSQVSLVAGAGFEPAAFRL